MGIMRIEVVELGWSWATTALVFEREGMEPIPLVGGPRGLFEHQIRGGTRRRELGRLEKRRPDLPGEMNVDRDAITHAIRQAHSARAKA